MKVAVVSAGAMGASIGGLLVRNGVTVLTSLEGRGAGTAKRAAEAGMTAASKDELLNCDVFLSIVPPAHAHAIAKEFAALVGQTGRKPLYLDCNAVNPTTLKEIAATVEESDARFVDASIIGPPAKIGVDGPLFLLSGEHATEAANLSEKGLKVRVVEGLYGRASAVKMAYAGITKGLTALGTAMILGSIRGGVAEELKFELQESQSALFKRFSGDIPRMFPKAGRWVAEMDEIAGFLADDTPQGKMFRQIALLYEHLANEAGRDDIAELERFFEA